MDRHRRRNQLALAATAILACGVVLAMRTSSSRKEGGASGVLDEAPEAVAEGAGDALAEGAIGVLEGYRARGDCALAHAGYLDLAGDVWGCVIQGDGWADIVVVSARGSKEPDVRTVHLDAHEWEELHGEEIPLWADGVP